MFAFFLTSVAGRWSRKLHRERAGGNLFTSECHTSNFVEKHIKHGREHYIVHYGCRVPEHRARSLIRPEFQLGTWPTEPKEEEDEEEEEEEGETNNTALAWRQKS